MSVIVHYPKGEDNIKDLQKRVAAVHAKYVLEQLKTLHLSEEKIKHIINISCSNNT